MIHHGSIGWQFWCHRRLLATSTLVERNHSCWRSITFLTFGSLGHGIFRNLLVGELGNGSSDWESVGNGEGSECRSGGGKGSEEEGGDFHGDLWWSFEKKWIIELRCQKWIRVLDDGYRAEGFYDRFLSKHRWMTNRRYWSKLIAQCVEQNAGRSVQESLKWLNYVTFGWIRDSIQSHFFRLDTQPLKKKNAEEKIPLFVFFFRFLGRAVATNNTKFILNSLGTARVNHKNYLFATIKVTH